MRFYFFVFFFLLLLSESLAQNVNFFALNGLSKLDVNSTLRTYFPQYDYTGRYAVKDDSVYIYTLRAGSSQYNADFLHIHIGFNGLVSMIEEMYVDARFPRVQVIENLDDSQNFIPAPKPVSSVKYDTYIVAPNSEIGLCRCRVLQVDTVRMGYFSLRYINSREVYTGIYERYIKSNRSPVKKK